MLIAGHELQATTGSDQAYNTFDCCLTSEILTKIREKHPTPSMIYGFERALQAPVLEMMLRGFRIDPGAREVGMRKLDQDVVRLDYILSQLAEAVWEKHLNPNSGPQLKEFFYGHLGLTPITVTVKGEVKTPMDREVLEQLGNHYEVRFIVQTILDRRDIAKQLKTLQTEVDSDWRMRTSYNIGGTKEGRFSSSKSPEGTGSNLQNITEDLRHIFISDPGWKLYCVDLEQADSREVGWLCGILFNDWSYLDACESGDTHTFVCRMTWPELPWNGDLKKDRLIAERPFLRTTYRQASKKLGHGVNFFGKPYTMARETGIPQKLVAAFVEKYFIAFPCIPQWHQWTAQELQTKMQLTSAFGRTRDFFDRPNSEDTLRKGLAFLAASATADNLNLGMWRIWKHMPQVQLLAQLHDAVYFQARETERDEEVVHEASKHVEVPLRHGNRTFIVPVEAKNGWCWGSRWKQLEDGTKREVHPKGLDKIGAKRNF